METRRCTSWSLDHDPSTPQRTRHSTRYRYLNSGRRWSNEDAHIVHDSITGAKGVEVAFYGVYDGHGGAECAIETSNVLHNEILHHPDFPEDLPNLMREVFLASDKKIMAVGKAACMSFFVSFLSDPDLNPTL